MDDVQGQSLVRFDSMIRLPARNIGEPTESGLMDDARATIATAAGRVGPMVVWGHSLGSGVAARMASEGRAAGIDLPQRG